MMKTRSFAYRCLNLLSAVILVVGLGGAVLIYQSAVNEEELVSNYEGGEGPFYPVPPEYSKKYQRDLELYGGKGNVLATQFRRWFVGLWHGRTLAYILASWTVLVSFGVLYAAGRTIKRDSS